MFWGYVVDFVRVDCCDSAVGDEGLTAGGGRGGLMARRAGRSRGSLRAPIVGADQDLLWKGENRRRVCGNVENSVVDQE